MKRFYNKKIINHNKIIIMIILVIFFDIVLISSYINKLGKTVVSIAKIKIEELTRYYVNQTIKKYLNYDVSNYINLNLVNNNIVSIDIDNNNCNKLLKNIINDLENNIKDIEKGNVLDYYNLEIINGDNGLILMVPTGVIFNNAMLANFGPKIPVKASFLENLDSNIDVDVTNYGINNALIKLYVIINIKELYEDLLENLFIMLKKINLFLLLFV